MVVKSYGKMRGTRNKLKRKPINLTRFIDKFKLGEIVKINVATQKKMPHPKYHNMSGKIIETKGNSYLVEVKDMNSIKKIYVRPEHLKR